jgi:cobalt-zinc-cadmium efflux system outer membrane protein
VLFRSQSYESGESSYLAVLTAQRSYSETRLAWLDALEQLWTATVEIQGLLLSGSLE